MSKAILLKKLVSRRVDGQVRVWASNLKIVCSVGVRFSAS